MQKIKSIIKSILSYVEDAQMQRAQRVLACYKKNGSLGSWQ